MGAIYFQQGATNAALHENAKEKFFKTRELIAKVISVLLPCSALLKKKEVNHCFCLWQCKAYGIHLFLKKFNGILATTSVAFFDIGSCSKLY